jgi:hypothetical protein
VLRNAFALPHGMQLCLVTANQQWVYAKVVHFQGSLLFLLGCAIMHSCRWVMVLCQLTCCGVRPGTGASHGVVSAADTATCTGQQAPGACRRLVCVYAVAATHARCLLSVQGSLDPLYCQQPAEQWSACWLTVWSVTLCVALFAQ